MKKIFPLFIISILIVSVFSFFSTENFSASALEIGKQARIIASHCNVYSMADFNSEKTTIIIEEKETALLLKHGDIVDVVDEENDFAKIQTDANVEGWVYKYYLTQNSSQIVYPVYNATIRNDTEILDMDFQSTTYKALKGTRVFIYKSYTEKEGHTSIQIVLDDQTLYNGYVLTKDVKPDGISRLLIVGISIIAAAVTVILSVVFIKKKKKK